MKDEILNGLTAEQKEAVSHTQGPLLVVAGAGSGKTRVITRRIAWIVESGENPYSILGITFTNKAAKEMRERVERWVDSPRMWLYTFHAACARILRREISKLPPYTSDFTIYDETDKRALLKSLCNEFNIDVKQYKPTLFGNIISNFKNSVADLSHLNAVDEVPAKIMVPFFEKYSEMLRTCNALDFDDLLYITLQLFRNEPEVLERYRRRFKYILVDEYQDTNRLQYSLLKELAAPSGNICATGDPDQAIYGWRGADINNILNFDRDFTDAKRITLEKNFRSTNAILKTANKLIQLNEKRLHKALYSDLGEGEKPTLVRASDDSDEAMRLIDKIRGMVSTQGCDYDDFAIFYRVNAQSRPFEAACRVYDIPYVLVGAVEFYRRKVVKDLIAYLKVLLNPNDEVSLLRIINTPTRGLGAGTVLKVKKRASETHRGFLEIVNDPKEWGLLGKRGALSVEGFHKLYTSFASFPKKPVAPLLRYIIEATKYRELFKNTRERADADALENIKALIDDAALFDTEMGGGLREYLERVALISDIDNIEEGQGAVTLMTFHAAKGLEFPHVILSGAEEGLLPHERSKSSEDNIEEERRLFYVGITRAQKTLTISFCRKRMMNGKYSEVLPSRFLAESGLRGTSNFSSRIFTQQQEQRKPVVNFDLNGLISRARSNISAIVKKNAPEIQENDITNEENEQFVQGALVEHPQFGRGKIESITREGSGGRMRVFFRYYGVKTLRYDIAVKKLTLISK